MDTTGRTHSGPYPIMRLARVVPAEIARDAGEAVSWLSMPADVPPNVTSRSEGC